MRYQALWIFVGTMAGWSLAGPPQVLSQTLVQLPTFRQFHVQGGLMIPDGGSSLHGAVSRAAMASRQAGLVPWRPWSNSATGGSAGVGLSSVQVQVYSLREMEAEVPFSEPPFQHGTTATAHQPQVAEQAEQARQQLQRFQQLQTARIDQQIEDAKEDVRWARRFAAEGNRPAAEFYYQRAIRRLPEELAEVARSEFDRYRAR